jgi:hypothetical protein
MLESLLYLCHNGVQHRSTFRGKGSDSSSSVADAERQEILPGLTILEKQPPRVSLRGLEAEFDFQWSEELDVHGRRTT